MEGSYTSLLNDGSFEFEELVFSQPLPQSQTQPQQEQTQPQQEAAWLNISMDPIQGKNQTHTCYWDRIWKNFNENKGGLASDRTTNSLCNRWCTINEKVAKFIGFCNQVFSKNQSGLTEQNKIDQALQLYESVMNEKFLFMRHCNALRFAPKFQVGLDKKTKTAKDKDASSQSVDNQIPTSLESDERMERPIGRKTAKKLKRAGNEAKDEESLELLKAMQKDALAIASSRSESVNMSLQLLFIYNI